MHNLALALQQAGHGITGSDDAIKEPSRSRLASHGLLPKQEGWFPERIHPNLDAIIVGMHARPDNPELARAQDLQLPVYSFPEFMYQQTRHQKRVVIAGSHGKTTVTSMVLHVLQQQGISFNYLVGAQLDGFDLMVRLSPEAKVAIFEGDEYLTSPLDRRPKFMHYHPHIAVFNGIAWDHINVFPEFDTYKAQFAMLAESMPETSQIFYYAHDAYLPALMTSPKVKAPAKAFSELAHTTENGQTYVLHENQHVPVHVFGRHNMQNLAAAREVCLALGIGPNDFSQAIQSFRGASRRLELLKKNEQAAVYQDFAHAPSKVAATVAAVKMQYPNRRLVACLELHTFSSLNKEFIPHYHQSLKEADEALVFFNPETVQLKRLPSLNTQDIRQAFDHPHLTVLQNPAEIASWLKEKKEAHSNLLLMSSGDFAGLALHEIASQWLDS